MYLCSVLYVLLQLWLLCVCLQVCVGPVCEGHYADVPRTGMYTWILQIRQLDGLPSTRRWAVEVYVPSDPYQAAPVVFGYTLRAREHHIDT